MRGRGEFVFWVFRQRHVGAGCGSFRMRSHPRTPFPRRAARGCAHALFRKCLSTLHVILCSKKRSSSYAHQSPPLYLPPHIVWAALATHTTCSCNSHHRGVPLAWLLLRHTVCAPRRRVVCGCICCAPACLLLLHCCADLRDNDPRAVSKVVCPSPPRTSLCGKPRRTAMSAGRNHMRIQLLLQTEGRARLVWARASRQRAIGASD